MSYHFTGMGAGVSVTASASTTAGGHASGTTTSSGGRGSPSPVSAIIQRRPSCLTAADQEVVAAAKRGTFLDKLSIIPLLPIPNCPTAEQQQAQASGAAAAARAASERAAAAHAAATAPPPPPPSQGVKQSTRTRTVTPVMTSAPLLPPVPEPLVPLWVWIVGGVAVVGGGAYLLSRGRA